MTPKIFARLFMEGHRYPAQGTMENINCYREALATVGILLDERPDLVSHYLAATSLSDNDMEEIKVLIYTEAKIGFQSGTKDAASQTIPEEPRRATSLHSSVKAEDMVLLADCANQARLFKGNITPSTMSALMNGRLLTPLVADNLMGIAYLFDQLSCMKLICRRWQSVLERNGSILLQGENKPQTHTNYSSALNRGKACGNFRHKEDIDICLNHIAAKMA